MRRSLDLDFLQLVVHTNYWCSVGLRFFENVQLQVECNDITLIIFNLMLNKVLIFCRVNIPSTVNFLYYKEIYNSTVDMRVNFSSFRRRCNWPIAIYFLNVISTRWTILLASRISTIVFERRLS